MKSLESLRIKEADKIYNEIKKSNVKIWFNAVFIELKNIIHPFQQNPMKW
jgi:hypothetical protein